MDANAWIAIVSILLLIGILISMGIGRLQDRQAVKAVKHSQPIMSRPPHDTTENTPLSLRQTEVQTDKPALSREIMLDIYRLLREHQVPREKARPVLKAAGIPLDNNLWSQVAPPSQEPTELTPIAGRPKSGQFHDPALEYQPPPR